MPAALPFGGCQGVPCLGQGDTGGGCHPVPPELGVLRHGIGRTMALQAGIPGRRQQSGTGRGRCAQQAELLARCSRMWDGCPEGHAGGFWGHRPQPTLLPPPLLAPALATAWGHPCSLGAPWGLRSGVPSTTRWHRLAAMVAAMGEGGGRAQTQPWTLHGTHGCHGARVSATSMPCARATIVGGPSTAGDGSATGCRVAWWVSPSPSPCPRGGHHPGTMEPWHWMGCSPAPRAARLERAAVLQSHQAARLGLCAPGSAVGGTRSLQGRIFGANKEKKPHRPGAALPSARAWLFLVPRLIEIHGGKRQGKRGDGVGCRRL